MPVYDETPAHSFLRMLDPKNGLAPGDPAKIKMAARIIESVDVERAPLRVVLESQTPENTIAVLRKRIEGFEAHMELAASTDVPSDNDEVEPCPLSGRTREHLCSAALDSPSPPLSKTDFVHVETQRFPTIPAEPLDGNRRYRGYYRSTA
jgi:hypothetical protein